MFKKVITLFLFFFTQSVMADNLGIKSKMDIEEQEYNQKIHEHRQIEEYSNSPAKFHLPNH